VTQRGDYQYTYTRYRQLLDELTDVGLSFTTYGGNVSEGEVLLRHDVDLSVERAVRMAEIEASANVDSTYYFLLTSRLYNIFNDQTRNRIDRIQSLGHDIGLHFSTHQYYNDAPGDEQLIEDVNTEREMLESVTGVSVDTVSFHVPPEWVLRRSFDGFVSTYEERFFWRDRLQRRLEPAVADGSAVRRWFPRKGTDSRSSGTVGRKRRAV